MALLLINSNFSTLNTNLELLKQTESNQIITQSHYPPNQMTYIENQGSVVIDLWENGSKKYNHIVLIGDGHDGGLPDFTIVFQESNDNINFFSDGVPLNIRVITETYQGTGLFTFSLTSRNIASRYCRIYSRNFVGIGSLTSIKSTL
jgi:hypothetical protein